MRNGRLRAVLCGIDEYGGVVDDLQGCVNDIDDVRDMLLDVFSAPPELMTVLRNAQATRGAIETALSGTVAEASPGDRIYVHLAGHGSSVPDRDGDESDGRDEIFCTADHDWQNPLSDDHIRQILDRAAPGVSVTFVADSCHSGSITRSDVATATRYAPWPRDTFPEGRGRRRPPRPDPAAISGDGITIIDRPEIVFTACNAEQTSAEIAHEGLRRGAFTQAFVAAVRRSGGTISHRDLQFQVSRRLRLRGVDQTPQLEARSDALDRPFLAEGPTAS